MKKRDLDDEGEEKADQKERGERKEGGTESECSICFTVQKNKETLPCNHSFCFECIGQWRKQRGAISCPMCRQDSVLVRVYLRPNCDEEPLLFCRLQQEFGQRICEPLTVFFGRQLFTVFVLPESLLAAFDSVLAEFYLCRKPFSLGGRQGEGSGEGENKEKYIIEKDGVSTSSTKKSEKVVLLKQQITNALGKDPRLKRILTKKNTKERFLMFCRMLEYELCAASASASLPTPAPPLKPSALLSAIQSSPNITPISLLQNYGEEWVRVCAKLPREEVEHVARATRNLALTENAENAEAVVDPERENNAARSIILWNRLRNPICACCWLFIGSASASSSTPASALQCCSHCECTLYCSEECRDIDWPSHSKWCCNLDARRIRGGALEMVCSSSAPASSTYVGASPFEFTAGFVADAFH